MKYTVTEVCHFEFAFMVNCFKGRAKYIGFYLSKKLSSTNYTAETS